MNAALERVRQRKFTEAAAAIRSFNEGETFLPGIGLTAEGLEKVHREALHCLFAGGLPGIIGSVTPEVAELLMVAGAMSLLGAAKAHKEHLPQDLHTGSHLSNEVAVRMVTFAAMYRQRMAQFRKMGVIHLRIIAVQDGNSGEACAVLNEQRFTLDEAPEVPYAGCTCEIGCRCQALAILEEHED